MRILASLLLHLMTNELSRQLIILSLEKAAAKTTNTVDDQVVAIVRQALANRINPIQRVVGK
jgi:hypothetical protein